ncbi:hypothetical protein ACHAXT_005365 [Thalassiosira profunda]
MAPFCKGAAFVTPRPSSAIHNNKCPKCPEYPTCSTALSMSSSPSSRQSYSSQGKRTQQTRNRGANAANHNRRGHSFRLENKDGTTKRHRKSNTKRAPRWEREGDRLYAEVTKQLDGYQRHAGEDENVGERLMALANKQMESAQDVCEALAPWTATDEQLQEAKAKKKEPPPTAEDSEEEKPKKSPPFLWGSLPVGPVLASRLHASQRSSPTSVQRGAFPILTAGHSKGNKRVTTKRTNAIIASPTGTGKTLAYLLPLLCTSPGGQSGEGTGGVLIVTPTIELACQIQREVDVLWPPLEDSSSSSLFVVGVDDVDDNMQESVDDDESMNPGRVTLKALHHAPLIAGTPKMLRMLYREAERIVRAPGFDRTISTDERATAKALLSNLRAIVLDEADRLLRTEAVAREATERKQRKIAQRIVAEAEAAALDSYIPPPPAMKKRRLNIARNTQTELLLRDLPIPSLTDVQIICASATIGRTMRRQLMQILDAPSADKAATLVTGDEDERVKSKDAERRKSVLLPEKLRHEFRVVGESDSSDKDLPDEDKSAAERNEERRIKDTMNALWETMATMEEAKPILVFPGRMGVESVQTELLARGLEDVRTLRNLDGSSPDTDIEVETADADAGDWKSVPVYIIGERFARGLDLPDVEYVFMLSPPSSAAGYAHMAGRTGRSGREGTAITLVRPKNNEVQRLAAIAEALGLKFASLTEQSYVQDGITTPPIELDSTACAWKGLSESELSKKKNTELYEYLISCGGTINKRSKKAELVTAIQELHSSS